MEDEPLIPDLFRPSKRRKFFRKKIGHDADEGEDGARTSDAVAPVAAPEPMTVDELVSQGGVDPLQAHPNLRNAEISIQEVIRQRKATQRRKGGIEFSNHSVKSIVPQISGQLVDTEDVEEEIPDDIQRVISRFAPQTGQVTDDNDKHMLAYIESEISKKHHQVDDSSDENMPTTARGQRGGKLQSGKQPATLGRLHEVDLGPDAKARNVALTEAAQRRLDGQSEEDEKPRLRRDGKPFRRKRRTSTDIKRDKLVEEVMRESRLEIYDEDVVAAEDEAGEDAADDRIADQFRRDFLDAVRSRRRRVPASASAKTGGKAVPSEPRGPKLGGSRSARAKVREKALEEAAKGKRR